MARRDRLNSTDEIKVKYKVNLNNIKEVLALFKYAKPYRGYFVAGLAAIALSSATTLSFPFLLKKLIDTAHQSAGNGLLSNPNSIAQIMILILLLQMVFSFSRVYFFSQVGEKALADLRIDVFNTIIRLPMSFFAERRVGELSSRISSDLSQIQDAVSFMLADLLRTILTLGIGISLILFISIHLTIIMLSVLPAVVILAIIFGKHIRKKSKIVQDQLADSNTIVQESFSGIVSVKSFANEYFESNRYANALNNMVKTAINNAKTRGLFISLMIFSLFGTIILVVWNGVGLMLAGKMSFGDLTAFVLYTSFVGGSMAGFADLYSSLQKTIGATERIRELLNEQPEIPSIDKSNILNINKIEGNISINNLSFSYPNRSDVQTLKDLNFSVKAGQTVALVGTSGAGKSTLVSLLMRFWKPKSGHIEIDGRNLEDYPISELRQQMAYVPQDILLFGGTIRENIEYGKPGASIDEIREASIKAFADNFINEFPEGYNTVVGERGIKLSGGQRQRIAIARAILRDPKILILDEATSSLDSASEKLVQQALDNLMLNRTSIVIAHRLSTIRNADQIFVMDKGSIREFGTHDSLLEMNGLYAHLVSLQFNNG